MRIDAVKTKSKLNMFIRNKLCLIRGHRLKTSVKHHCGAMIIEQRTYCNRCGAVTGVKAIGGI